MSEPLRPATYGESPKDAGFGPRIPWIKLLVGVTLVASALGFYFYREARKVDAVRAEILSGFQAEIGPVAPRLRAFRERIERWVLEAQAIDDGESWSKPGFHFDELHDLRGVYLRISEAHAGDVESLRVAAASMAPDAIGRCLGISPLALRGFYERGRFMNEGFIEDVGSTDDIMRLRVMAEQLRGNLRRDLPLVLGTTESDYFLLVVQRGESRHRQPVDFYLWDLRPENGQLLVRARAEARGALLTARIGLPGAPRTKRPDISPRRTGAQDCSLAAQVRAATGEAPIEFQSEIAEPTPSPSPTPSPTPTTSPSPSPRPNP
jgi:hypothetical protein